MFRINLVSGYIDLIDYRYLWADLGSRVNLTQFHQFSQKEWRILVKKQFYKKWRNF